LAQLPRRELAPRTGSLAHWVGKQILGLVDGLRVIHTSECQFFGHGNPNPSNVKQKYGRHGDIKPENILWFKDEDANDQIVGSLLLADFGLTAFHETGATRVKPGFPVTLTYMPPELANDHISQSNDIWSLGYVLLEFVTWYLLGEEGYENFEESRMHSDHDGRVINTYFILDVEESEPIGRTPQFVAKPNLVVLNVS
jgi:serine/threonine protein kinase